MGINQTSRFFANAILSLSLSLSLSREEFTDRGTLEQATTTLDITLFPPRRSVVSFFSTREFVEHAGNFFDLTRGGEPRLRNAPKRMTKSWRNHANDRTRKLAAEISTVSLFFVRSVGRRRRF